MCYIHMNIYVKAMCYFFSFPPCFGGGGEGMVFSNVAENVY